MNSSLAQNRDISIGEKKDRLQRQRGFTIMETSIALVIMMIAVLGAISVFAYAINNNQGANDRELAIGVAQRQMEQLRNVAFTDSSLTATATSGATTTVTNAGRQYTVVKTITDLNSVSGQPTLKTITIQVTPLGGSALGSVSLRTQRAIR
jgi:Tfp pilus assembly protein PilV